MLSIVIYGIVAGSILAIVGVIDLVIRAVGGIFNAVAGDGRGGGGGMGA